MKPAPETPSAFEIAVTRLSYGFGAAGGAILVGVLLVIAVGVVSRYAFDLPITWADQVTTYGLVYATFIGAPRVLAKRGHVAVDVLHTALKPRQGELLYVILDVVGILYCVAFTYLAIQELGRVVARGSEFADAFTVPQWVVYIVIPVGAALLALQYVANFLADLRAWRKSGKASPA